MAETSPALANVSASGAQLARRLGALVPGPLREPLASLRRDLHVVLEGLAGRHPSPLLPRRPHGPAPSAGPAPRTLRVERVVRETADAVTLPFLAQRMQEIGGYWAMVRDWLLGRLRPEREPDPGETALVGLLLSFSGWQALVRQQQLSFEETKSLAVRTIGTMLTEDIA